ncbi:MAG: prephenate dehydrogenase [Marinoscillum sp.]
MKVLFVGTGLIGGSFSLAMQKHGLLSEAGGFSRKEQNLDRSVELGLIHKKFTDLSEGLKWADWIILSIPVDVINKMLPGILDEIGEEQLVVDFGSTKGKICETVRDHQGRTRFIAAHPIAGTEYSGPDAAFAELFIDKLMIICEDGKSNPGGLSDFEGVCKTIGMKLEYMNAEAHDRHLAYISHLSHITSFALSNTVLDKEKDGDIILELAGSGFASTVRLAKSSPEMWAPIFFENKKMVLEALENFQKNTDLIKQMIIKDDYDGLKDFLEKGRAIKRVIN